MNIVTFSKILIYNKFEITHKKIFEADLFNCFFKVSERSPRAGGPATARQSNSSRSGGLRGWLGHILKKSLILWVRLCFPAPACPDRAEFSVQWLRQTPQSFSHPPEGSSNRCSCLRGFTLTASALKKHEPSPGQPRPRLPETSLWGGFARISHWSWEDEGSRPRQALGSQLWILFYFLLHKVSFSWTSEYQVNNRRWAWVGPFL